jgi:hypothetical protein
VAPLLHSGSQQPVRGSGREQLHALSPSRQQGTEHQGCGGVPQLESWANDSSLASAKSGSQGWALIRARGAPANEDLALAVVTRRRESSDHRA